MRIVAQVLLCYVMLLVVGALWRLLPLSFVWPDIACLFAVYLGLTARRRLSPSLVGALAIGYVNDVLVGGPMGFLTVTAGVVCITGHVIQGRLLVRGFLFTAIFAAFTSLMAGTFLLTLLSSAALLRAGIGPEMAIVAQTAFATGLAGPLVFRACRAVDARFARTRRGREGSLTGVIP